MKSYHFLVSILLCSFTCLSQQTIGLFLNDSLSQNGYTLWSPNNDTYLIDNCGFLVNKWQSNVRPGLSAYLLENGNLLRTGSIGGSLNGAGSGGRIEEFDWEGNLLWTYDVSSNLYQQHHDIEPLPNGNVLLIAWERKTADEALAAGAATARTYWSEAIFELKKIGSDQAEIVWEWHLWDHLIQDIDSVRNNYGVIAEHPELLNINFQAPSSGGFGGGGDWLHFNAVEYDPERDEILLSSRTHSEIYIIDHSTSTEEAAGHAGGNRNKGGDILYRWGNPQAYNRGTSVHKKLFGPHDVQIIPESYPGGGHITIFNNGAGRPQGAYSSIEEISLPRDPAGNYIIDSLSAFGPEDAVWQYVADALYTFYSNNMAGAHRLPNGNTMICEANQGTFFEVDPEGEIVWLYQNTVGANGPIKQGTTTGAFGALAFRATRYPEDYPAFDGRDMTGSGPIELDPLPSDCIIYSDSNTSSTAQTDNQSKEVIIKANGEFITIFNTENDNLYIQLLDLQGRIILGSQLRDSAKNINISALPSGIYIVNIYNQTSTQFHNFKFMKP